MGSKKYCLAMLLASLCGQGWANDVVYYDFIDENGQLSGGVVPVDETNPMLAPVALGTKALRPAPYAATTILDNGPTTNRVDISIVGDGYTESELALYETHAQTVMDGFLEEEPFNTYRNYFNFHRVDVISNESGVDHDPSYGTLKDTALDMNYFCSGTERLLCINVSKAKAAAANAPDADQVLAIANSSKYGGAGYTSSELATLAGDNNSAIELALHELGHSFGDLADEYSYGGDETYAGSEPSAVNLSTYTADTLLTEQRKWFRWMGEFGVDAYEGGGYSTYGVYRPTLNSKMRSLSRDFEVVNAEQLIFKIYQTVTLIDSATSSDVASDNTVFEVSTVQPVGHDLSFEWYLDDVLIEGETAATLDISTLQVAVGDYQLTVKGTDPTDWVRDEQKRQQWMTDTRSWQVHIENATQPVVAKYDLNGDGVNDIFWRHKSSGENYLHLLSSQNTVQVQSLNQVSDPDWVAVASCDLDGDQTADVLWRHQKTGVVYLYFMSQGAIRQSVYLRQVDPSWKIVACTDLDQDGQSDILWRHDDGQLHWYRMNGSTVVESQTLKWVATEWSLVAVADFNGDQLPDLWWRHNTTGANYLHVAYMNQEQLTYETQYVNTVPIDQGWQFAGAGDFDGDGTADVMWRNTLTGFNHLYLMQEGSIKQSYGLNVVANLDWSVGLVRDLNADGVDDILWRHLTLPQLYVYYMQQGQIQQQLPLNAVGADWVLAP